VGHARDDHDRRGRGENGDAVSSYTDPPTSAQMRELARDVASIRTAIDRLVHTVDGLPHRYTLDRDRRSRENLWLFVMTVAVPLATVIFVAGIVSLARGR
jgi:hypothetical protein